MLVYWRMFLYTHSRVSLPLADVCSVLFCSVWYVLFLLVFGLYCKLVLLFFLGSLFPCTLQGRLFPLLVHVMFCWFPACIASLSCSFLIYTFLTFDQKKKEMN